jgi:hypothetical protein
MTWDDFIPWLPFYALMLFPLGFAIWMAWRTGGGRR